ncbi:MAG: carbohydrate-binding family V/XII [Thermoanaerobaculia bacterium]
MRKRPSRFTSFGAIRICLVLVLFGAGAARANEPEPWPREIETEKGLVVMYQPQVDRLEGDVLHSRAAVSVTAAGASEPIFGAVWMETRIATDLDTRVVELGEIRVPKVRFPDATPEQEQGLIDLLTREMPTWDVDLSLDRLIALLDIAEKQSLVAEDFDDAPPRILFRQEPTVLVTIDGPPQLREAGDSGVLAVVNSPFLILQDSKDKASYYLYAGAETWYRAAAVEGPWQVTEKVPQQIRQLEPEDEEVDPEEAAEGPGTPPAILVSTEPAELIVSDGPMKYEPLAGGELLVVTNSESDLLREVASQKIYVLLSGRWYMARTEEGPWELVRSDQLPESFARIDPDSDYGYLLVWVAGTEMSNEAILDAAIPQTAAIKRDATIQVSYDGEPQFEPVEETTLYYAVNTESQVIRSGSRYYCAEEGVWYVASNPAGPWAVATEVPEEIRSIPPSSPVYNTKYVYIYDTTPEVVYVGYYPGYTSSYIYHGVPVYGTGWYYRPWWGSYYYPRYRTWGFNVRYNPWYGWSFGLSYSTGPFTFSIGYGGGYRRSWWGPAGYRGYRHGYHRGWHHGYRAGTRTGYQAGYRSAKRDSARNMYQRQGNANRVAHTSGTRPGAGTAQARSPNVSNRANNVYTDKSGNVYRKQQDGSWQQRDGGSWKAADMSGAGGSREAATRPSTGTRPTDRSAPSTGAVGTQQNKPATSTGGAKQKKPKSSAGQYGGSSNLNRDASARQRGNQRANSAPRGGGARRGGGRRR